MLPGHQTEPGRKLSARAELCAIADRRDQRRRGDDTDAGDRRKTAARLVGAVPCQKRHFQLLDPGLSRAELLNQRAKRLACPKLGEPGLQLLLTGFGHLQGMAQPSGSPQTRCCKAASPIWLKRPVGRPTNDVRRYHAGFSYQAATWDKPRRVVAKVEWHPGELYPRVGFIVTNLSRPTERVVAFYNQRGTAEQWIKEGKNAIKWTRLSCRKFRHNAVRLQLHALAYNLGNFMRTLVLPDAVEQWSLTTLREKLVKIGAKIVRHGRYIVFQMAEVAIPRDLFADILRRIDRLRTTPLPT